ncbi:hypothetical protein KP509_20G088200 [Ceratopteris richardii]|uniref:BHLH domain-containing protein n=1 Tax=Ceratopteris richardii TaxID=49495 RepID=A0A8T2SH34_CERRI|nr:hypothetical protein KP509_20G088200 [Ceratopteris richardii]KAH7332456.1 hypothetical protein KP509_20G088200 [Ceratopteris richardii]
MANDGDHMELALQECNFMHRTTNDREDHKLGQRSRFWADSDGFHDLNHELCSSKIQRDVHSTQSESSNLRESASSPLLCHGTCNAANSSNSRSDALRNVSSSAYSGQKHGIEHHRASSFDLKLLPLDPRQHEDHHSIPGAVHCDQSPTENNSGNSSDAMFSNLLNGDTTPFYLNRSSWPPPSSSCTVEEQSFFSSSIVTDDLTPDLSLTNSSISRTSSGAFNDGGRNAFYGDHGTTLAFFGSDGNSHLMEEATTFDQAAEDQSFRFLKLTEKDYESYTGDGIMQSYTHHVDFLGAGDGRYRAHAANGDVCHDFRSHQVQRHAGDIDHSAYGHNQGVHAWRSLFRCHEGNGFYPSISDRALDGDAQGAIEQRCSYSSNSMEGQQEATQHRTGNQTGHRHFPHSQSLPVFLQQAQDSQQCNSNKEQKPSGSFDERIRNRQDREDMETMMSRSTALNCASHDHELCQTNEMPIRSSSEGAWTAAQAGTRETPYVHSKKRQILEGEESDGGVDDPCRFVPSLKRSTSWNCSDKMSRASTSNKASSITSDMLIRMGSLRTISTTVPFSQSSLQHTVSNNRSASHVLNRNYSDPDALHIMMNTTTGPSQPYPSSVKQEKPQPRQGVANDPQSIAARHRRERISERLKTLQQMVPNGSKVDLVTMLEKAINYVKFLQMQVLASDEYWPTPLNTFPKMAAMAKLAADAKDPSNLEKIEKALTETIQTTS